MVFFMWRRYRNVRIYMRFFISVGCGMCIMCGFENSCDCVYLCGIGVDCFEDLEANESEKI